MGPHSDDLYGFNIFKDLINEAVLNIYAAAISAREISEELFMRRGALEGVLRKDLYRSFGLFP
jgi:hypothetical protein